MSASRFVGRVGGLAFALGVGVAIFSGPSVASADAGDTEAAAPQSGRSGATASASESRAASATRGGRTSRASAVPSASASARAVPASSAARTSTMVSATAAASTTEPDSAPSDAGPNPLAPVTAPLDWAIAAATSRLGAASATANAAVTNNGVTVNPTTIIEDGIILGDLNAQSATGQDLTYSFVGSSNGGKLDLGTVFDIPGTYTVLPYANWLDGQQKATQFFSVRVSENTAFDQFLTGIPLVGALASPIISLLQQTPFLSSLLAPIIGGSVLAEIAVDVALLAPGNTPVAYTYKVTSFDGVLISTNFFPASGLAAGETATTVLNGPGLGSPGETDPYDLAGTFGSVPGVAPMRSEGYNVITWDPRGEFASGGVLQLDNPFFEGRDASAIVSWAAENTPAVLNGPGDPAVGMVGGSYGGGIQMVTASTDPRIDAIVPNGNWYSLGDALYPAEEFKTAWAALLLLDLVEAGARINTQIYEGVLTGSLFGFLTETSQAVLASSGPTSLLNQLQSPTLLFQGTVDALFPLDQSVLNAEAITANPFGTVVKLAWFCGGHGSCSTGTPPAQQGILFDATFAWLDQYVTGSGQGADAVPVFQWWDQNAVRYTSDLLPFEPSFNQPLPYSTSNAGGTLGIIPILGGSGPNSAFAFPFSLIFPTPAGNAINVALTPDAGDQIVGAPQVSFTYSGLGTGGAVYAQFVDDATGLVVGNNVTAIPVILDGRERTVSMSLNDIAYTVGADDSLTLQIASWSSIFANAAIGLINISDIQVDLPLRATPVTT